MPKKLYVGVDHVARKGKKMYVGVENLARKVKKGYIGVGGVARPFFAGGELVYYGKASDLSVARRYLAATNVGNYALFGGGQTASDKSNVVDAYNKSLTRSTATALSAVRAYLAATTVGSYALFGGGNSSSGTSISSNGHSTVVDAYNASLTRSTPTVLSTKRYLLAATSVGNYALFGGGHLTSASDVVDAYNASLTRSTPTALSAKRRALAATKVGNYALFGGGYNSTVVDAYDTSLTRSTPTVLSYKRQQLAATNVGNYALFGGGNTSISTTAFGPSNIVDAYNTSLVLSTPTTLSVARRELSATTVGTFALFCGGDVSTSSSSLTHSKVTDAYDETLTRSVPTALNTARSELVATTIGDYALIGGGYLSSKGVSAVVDAYTVA